MVHSHIIPHATPSYPPRRYVHHHRRCFLPPADLLSLPLLPFVILSQPPQRGLVRTHPYTSGKLISGLRRVRSPAPRINPLCRPIRRSLLLRSRRNRPPSLPVCLSVFLLSVSSTLFRPSLTPAVIAQLPLLRGCSFAQGEWLSDPTAPTSFSTL